MPDHPVPDLLPDDLLLLFVGINPSLWSAATAAHFARPGNRFWPALALAGITGHLVDCKEGMSEDDRRHIEGRGIGITNFVARATARADELSTQEIRDGATRLELFVAERRPRDRRAGCLSDGLPSAPGHRRTPGRDPGRRRTVGAAQPVWAQRPRDGRQPGRRLRCRGGRGRDHPQHLDQTPCSTGSRPACTALTNFSWSRSVWSA